MSKALSPAKGAKFSGAVKITDDGPRGMITLRGDLSGAPVAKAIKAAVGLGLPGQREIKSGKKGAVAWMSPDELMVFCDYAEADALAAKMIKSLGDAHALVVNVSDARAQYTLKGRLVREVVAKGSPADLSPEAFAPGEMRRSRLGQVAVAFWMTDTETMHLVCFRSVGQFVFDWLSTVSSKGSMPGHFG